MTADDRGDLPLPSDGMVSPLAGLWSQFCDRVIQGLFLILPLLITCWVFYWLYSFIESYVVSPLTAMVVWKSQAFYESEVVPSWFQAYAAPAIGIILLALILFGVTFLASTRLHRATNWLLIHMPVFCWIYNRVRRVFQTLETHTGGEQKHKRPQRMVLVTFPHPGIKVPDIVTGTTRDRETGKSILCVYVPTTPVPMSGYFLLVPEDETTELNWSTEETLQSIISGGLATPPEVTYFGRLPSPTPPHPVSGTLAS